MKRSNLRLNPSSEIRSEVRFKGQILDFCLGAKVIKDVIDK